MVRSVAKSVAKSVARSNGAKTLVAAGVLSCLMPPQISRADDTPKPKPELIKAAGQPVRLKYADGREAVLKETWTQGAEVDIGFSINENTCNDKVGATCTYAVPMSLGYFFFAWSKNPDASKLNQELVVPASASGSEQKIEFTAVVSSIQKNLYTAIPELGAIGDSSIRCSSFDWFEPNDPSLAGGRKVRMISTEQNQPNAETHVDENRFFSTVRDISFTPLANNALLISTASLPPGNNSVPLLFFGDSAWYVKSRSGDVCQFTARAQFADAVNQFNSIDAKRTPPATEKTIYIYGSASPDKFFAIDSNVDQQLQSSVEDAQ